MANYDYEIVNGRKIRVRPKETVSEIDKNGYFRRQPNHFTTPFGDGENDLKAEGTLQDESTAELEQDIANIDAINTKVRANAEKNRVQAEADELAGQ